MLHWNVPAIERISLGELDRLWPDYVLRNRPVIIRDLIKPQRGFEALLERFADVEVPSDLGTTLGDVLAQTRRGERASPDTQPRSQVDRAEMLTRPELVEAMLTNEDRRAWERIGNVMFCGSKGESTMLHFDGWVAATMHYQLAGTKEWFLAAPESCAVLMPIGHRPVVDAMALSMEKRDHLAEVVDGYSFVLEAGETLYFPQQWLHGTRYATHSFSFNDHIGRNPYGNFFTREVHPSLMRHAVLQRLFPQARAEEHRDVFQLVHDACKHDDAEPHAHATRVYEALRVAYDRLFPERPFAALPSFVDMLEREAIARAVGDRTLVPASEFPFYPSQVETYRATWHKLQELPLFDWW
jgi:hypothetical protein